MPYANFTSIQIGQRTRAQQCQRERITEKVTEVLYQWTRTCVPESIVWIPCWQTNRPLPCVILAGATFAQNAVYVYLMLMKTFHGYARTAETCHVKNKSTCIIHNVESNIADKTEILAKMEGEKIKEQLNRETARKNLDGQRKAQVQC